MHQSDTCRVTVVVVPRERFSESEASLESIIEHTTFPHRLIYVDGNGPPALRRHLEQRAAEVPFDLIRVDRYLSPNEARNIGLTRIDTEYVVFVDNDLIVTAGWLEALVERADRCGAAVVGPLYFQGDPDEREIHMAGGDLSFEGEPGHRTLATTHRHQGEPLDDLATPLVAEPVDFVEFHCLLARTEVVRRLGMDERLLNTREHLDLCLDVVRDGGEVWFEPASQVTYSTPPPLRRTDVAYFMVRWSEAWTASSLEHFCAKYELDPAYAERAHIMRSRRQLVFAPVRKVTRRALGERGDRAVGRGLRAAERRVNQVVCRVP